MTNDARDVFGAFTNRDAADGKAGKLELTDAFRAPGALIKVGAALNDTEERLFVRTFMRANAAFKPSHGACIGCAKALSVIISTLA